MTAARDAHTTHTVGVALSSVASDVLLAQLGTARHWSRSDPDPFARRTWELRMVELQREIAIRNVRATARLGEGVLSEPHIDALEKFVDRMGERHPETCEAIAAALALIARLVPKEDDRG